MLSSRPFNNPAPVRISNGSTAFRFGHAAADVTESIQFPGLPIHVNYAVYGAWPWDGNFLRAFAKALELAVRYQPDTYCLRSGGLAA
jgi:hypothetical protein